MDVTKRISEQMVQFEGRVRRTVSLLTELLMLVAAVVTGRCHRADERRGGVEKTWGVLGSVTYAAPESGRQQSTGPWPHSCTGATQVTWQLALLVT